MPSFTDCQIGHTLHYRLNTSFCNVNSFYKYIRYCPLALSAVFLFPYIICWKLRIDSSSLLYVFWVLEICLFFSFALIIVPSFCGKGKINYSDAIFWILLFLCLYFPGAYLEYPSDAIEHFRRIFRWQQLGLIHEYPVDIKYKFEYFFNFSLLAPFPIELRRSALDLLSATWQLLICVQIYRLSIVLGFTKHLSFLSVISFLCCFGTNVFGIRYYALSSTLFAYAVYIEAVIQTIYFNNSKDASRLLMLPLLGVLAYFNHKQELLFILAVVPALLSFGYLSRDNATDHKKILCASLGVISLGFVLGYLAKFNTSGLTGSMSPDVLSRFGGFKIWSSFYQETLGVHGWIAVFLGILIARKFPLLVFLSFLPLFILVFPPSAIAVAKIFPSHYLTYRILYAFPLSFVLVQGLYQCFSCSFFKSNFAWIATLVCIFLVTSNPSFPWRGRLFFQFHQPLELRTLKFVDQTAKWFFINRDIEKLRSCWITTDDATKTVLYSHFGANESVTGGESARRGRFLEGRINTTTLGLSHMVNMDSAFCGILVGQKEQIPAVAPSEIGELSQHWYSNIADLHWSISDGFQRAAEVLVEKGWTKTKVPPFYYLFEPPSSD